MDLKCRKVKKKSMSKKLPLRSICGNGCRRQSEFSFFDLYKNHNFTEYEI